MQSSQDFQGLLSTVSIAGTMPLWDSTTEASQLKSMLLSDRHLPPSLTPGPSTSDSSTFARKSPMDLEDCSIASPSVIITAGPDNEDLNDEQIRKIIELKMSKLEKYNSLVMTKKEKHVYQKYRLTPSVLATLVRCQRRIRARAMRRKFFQALRMNDILETKQCSVELASSLQRYKRKLEDMKTPFYEGILDFIM